VVDEDFIQRGLLFKDRLPQISSGQPDSIAVQTSFGWTEDDATVDDTISVDSPRWRAALGNNTVQAAGSLSNSAWHDGNAVSFTIDNLRETLTKNLQPLTQVPIGLRAKTYESNKTLGYAVQAQALALFRYYDMTDSGSVPGFRRDAILSNFHQTPLQAKPGTPVVFEFDLNAINFESGNPSVNFGLSEDPQTAQYAFFSHGELSQTDTGWHVRVPWTATSLSPPTGLVTVVVSEASDPAKYGFAEQDFAVSLDQESDRSAEVQILGVNPNPIKVEASTDVTVRGRISSKGMTNPSYSWTVSFFDDDGDLFSLVGGETADIAVTQTFSPYNLSTTSELTVHIDATVYDIDHPERGALNVGTVSLSGGGNGGGTVGGGGSGSGTGSSEDVTVAVENLTKLEIYPDSRKDLAQLLASSDDVTVTDDAVRRLGNVFPYGLQGSSDKLFLSARGLNFKPGQEPSTVTVVLKGELSGKSVPGNLTKQEDGSYEGELIINSQLILPKSDLRGNPKTTYVAGDALTDRGVLAIAQMDRMMRAINLSAPLADTFVTYQKPIAKSGNFLLREHFAKLPSSTEAIVTAENLKCFGFEEVTVIVDPALNEELKSTVQARIKIRQPAEMACLNLHGEAGQAGLKVERGLGLNQAQPEFFRDAGSFATLKTLMLASCEVLDLGDLNNNYGRPQEPFAVRPKPGLRWWNACEGNTALLGYNLAVREGVVLTAFAQYAEQLKLLNDARVEDSEVQQIAWLAANLKGTSSVSPLKMAACAWSKQYYYYVSTDRPLKTAFANKDRADIDAIREGRARPRTGFGIYRVAIDANGPKLPVRVVPGDRPTGGASKVDINGFDFEVRA
jgi:hypothetical protein